MLRPTSVRSQRASSISAPHDLRANSEVGRHFPPCTTSVRRLIDLGSPSSIRTILVRRLLDLGSPSPIRTTSVRRSLDLGPPSPIRTTSVRRSLDLGPPLRLARPRSIVRSDSHDLDIGKNQRTQEVGERLKRSVNSELLKRSMIDPNRSVNNSK